MLRIALCLLVAVLGLASAHAQSSWVDRIEIVEVGLFTLERTKSIDDSNLAPGRRHEATNFRLLRATSDVPAQLELSFGIRYRVVGPNPGQAVNLRVVVRFPEQGLRNPAKGETHYRNDFPSQRAVGEEAAFTYAFDEPWEAVPGIWIFEVWYGNQKLAEQNFNVYRP